MQKLLELWLEAKLQTQVYRKENFTTITWFEMYFYPALLLEVLMSPFWGGVPGIGALYGDLSPPVTAEPSSPGLVRTGGCDGVPIVWGLLEDTETFPRTWAVYLIVLHSPSSLGSPLCWPKEKDTVCELWLQVSFRDWLRTVAWEPASQSLCEVALKKCGGEARVCMIIGWGLWAVRQTSWWKGTASHREQISLVNGVSDVQCMGRSENPSSFKFFLR